jgi:hypothetical protein
MVTPNRIGFDWGFEWNKSQEVACNLSWVGNSNHYLLQRKCNPLVTETPPTGGGPAGSCTPIPLSR